jgi:hypothetical protein
MPVSLRLTLDASRLRREFEKIGWGWRRFFLRTDFRAMGDAAGAVVFDWPTFRVRFRHFDREMD